MENKDEDREKQNQQIKNTLSNMTRLAFSMVLSVFLGFIIGKYLDTKFDSSPTLLIIGIILGVISSFKNLYDTVKRI